MQKKISFISQGRSADRGENRIDQLLPNKYTGAVGPFVFLDHHLPTTHRPGEQAKILTRRSTQPHRGIATLTYILEGEAEHFDSAGNHAIVQSGGIHWTKTASGIILDEDIHVDKYKNDLITHAIRCWINLPPAEKASPPDYLPVQANEVPKQILMNDAGWLKVVAGEYLDDVSKIPAYSGQLLFHIHLNSRQHFSINTNPEWSYAAFLLLNNAIVNDSELKEGDFLLFEKGPGFIGMGAYANSSGDIILLGGEQISESIVAHGPFVMNTKQEIATAYADFHEGKFGQINYKK